MMRVAVDSAHVHVRKARRASVNIPRWVGCQRCTWRACRAQLQHPMQRGVLTGVARLDSERSCRGITANWPFDDIPSAGTALANTEEIQVAPRAATLPERS